MKDPRLQNLKGGEYRMWHDGHDVLLPVGMSTTKPGMRELVGVNVRVFGGIENGNFLPPFVSFKNNTNGDDFDGFYLSVFRDFDIDGDIDLTIVNILSLAFNFEVFFNGFSFIIPQKVRFFKENDNAFYSDEQYVNTLTNPQLMQNEPYFITFELRYLLNQERTNSYLIGDFRNNKLYVDVGMIEVTNGSSTYYYNSVFNPTIPLISYGFLGNIDVIGGWS